MALVAATYNPGMRPTSASTPWNILPPVTIPSERRLEHVRSCSDFAAGVLDRYPQWGEETDRQQPPEAANLATEIGLEI